MSTFEERLGRSYHTRETLMNRLAVGNSRRQLHAALIGQLEREELTLRQALVDRRAEKLPVHRLLRGVRGVGWTKADRACAAAGVDPGKASGRLTARQRGVLVEALLTNDAVARRL